MIKKYKLGIVLLTTLTITTAGLTDAATDDAATVDIFPIRKRNWFQATDTVPPPSKPGLWGMPLAPVGLSRCDEMEFYRAQAGMPAYMDGVGFRESSCRNDVVSSIGCCYGYWQAYVSLHLRDAKLSPRYARCEVDEISDVYGNLPLQKQKNACVAKAILDIQGIGAYDAA
jgi:hypothetical protein